MLVKLADLPTGGSRDFRDTKFFANTAGSLPSPEEVCKTGVKIDDEPVSASRPRPVVFRDLGLLVKFGSEITIAEAQCLWFFNHHMKDKVPTPELYGWRTHGDQVFIYMELIHGDTLKERWPNLSDGHRDVILQELRGCVDAWRELSQEKEPYFIGHIGGQGVGDIIFREVGDAHPGPFENIQAFHNYFARLSCRRHPEWNPRRDFEELEGLTDDRAVVFTHADLDKSNILISPAGDGGIPHVVAIIDWHQSGWYPVDWEWLKAQRLCEAAPTGGRDSAWVAKMIDPADDAYFYGWEYIVTSV